MAQVEVKVPDIGDFKDVAVIEVMVKVGETIAVDTGLVMVESDKASLEAFRRAYPDFAIELFDGGDDFRRIRRVLADADLVLTM
ncbi:MAG: hypothetical protein IIZ92_21930, partial [Aquincola sp.]|nr:hypothetical protein [Aquincola sp.]